jgi:hypothetical protein
MVSSPSAPETPTIEASSSGIRGQRLAGVIVGGAGALSAGVGAVFALSANATYDSSNSHCNAQGFCDGQGLDERTTARHRAAVATGTLIGGGILFAAGVALYLTAPSPRADSAFAPRLRISAGVLPGSKTAFTLTGNW